MNLFLKFITLSFVSAYSILSESTQSAFQFNLQSKTDFLSQSEIKPKPSNQNTPIKKKLKSKSNNQSKISYLVLQEEGKKSTSEKSKNIEMRSYSTEVVARMVVTGNRQEALFSAFRVLAEYIRGENDKEQSIPMTSPVLQQQIAKDKWVVDFIMPTDIKKKDLPKPKDQRITITRRYKNKKITIQFSGLWTDSNFYKHQKQLEKYLKDLKYSYHTYPILAYYNSPFQPWFLRRNEVMYIIKK